MKKNKYFLVIPASGIGKRMNSDIPKQYLHLDNGITILDQCLKAFLSIESISGFVVALANKDTQFESSLFAKHSKLIAIASGGKERFHSVLNALNSLDEIAEFNDWVLVHDSVRPCIKQSDIEKLIEEISGDAIGGILANRVADTVKQKNTNGLVSTIDRKKLHMAQTPQMFRFGILKKAIKKIIKLDMHITDESEALEYLGHSVRIVNGSSSNIKITNKDDIDLANYFLNQL